jgi:hypothetical protein
MISRTLSEPSITWGHIDGPLLTCTDGSMHWLTFVERVLYAVGYLTVEKLDRLHRKDVPLS